MSPHVAITTALLELEHPDTTDHAESLTEGLIVRHFTTGAINAEEFHHYSAWLLKISRLRKEAA
ncbi:hypothetical protein [Pseudomonas sp. AU8050]|uniref:hypothetical protein n=1 Tax=Pseudomonas sp. AU8050 TaxID=2681497 RepID=UPI0014085F04|nr:hypothetical protein [Pseudomonas sp. AU8050]NHC51494.1 hypothetical protein [Pseudomonas sp. AU8050]